jgi:signal transduction histidine kinase
MCLSGLLVFVFLLSWGSYQFFVENKINQLALNESEILSRSGSDFSREVGYIKRVTLLLKNTVNARLASQTEAEKFTSNWKHQVTEEFELFARTSDLISQVRWIMPNGKELIRINSQSGVITRVPDGQLQDKSDRDYVIHAPDDTGNEVYISSLDLNIENHEIVRPFQPTIRSVVRVSTFVSGFLVVNYDLSKLFEQMRTYSNDSVHLEVLDMNGNWVLSTDRTLEWGGILNSQDPYFNIDAHFPDIWESIYTSKTLERRFDDGRLWSFLTLHIDENYLEKQGEDASLLYFIAKSDAQEFAKWHMALLLSILGIASMSFIILAWLVWRQMTARFETYRLLELVQHEKNLAEQANRKLSFTNKRLVDLQDELVETSKLSSLGLMVSGLAHEMDTPLGGVKMALSSSTVWLEKEKDKLSENSFIEITDSISIAEKNLERALDVVTGFKRIASDRTSQDVKAFSFHNVLNDIVFTYGPILEQHDGISITTECAEDIHMVGFPGATSQIIQNLIDNALEYAFQQPTQGVISIVANKEGDDLIFTVEDNGNGISPPILDSIFQPFTTTGRKSQHTGLGLYLVNQWVYKLMKGRIEVITELGVGTKFIFTIPLKQVPDVVKE